MSGRELTRKCSGRGKKRWKKAGERMKWNCKVETFAPRSPVCGIQLETVQAHVGSGSGRSRAGAGKQLEQSAEVEVVQTKIRCSRSEGKHSAWMDCSCRLG